MYVYTCVSVSKCVYVYEQSMCVFIYICVYIHVCMCVYV